MNAENTSTPTPPVGVIESLSRGFETVAEHLPLLLLPLLLDLALWLGPRLSLRPAIAAYYHEMWQPVVSSLDRETQATFASFSDMLRSAAETMPDLYLPLLSFPSLIGGQEAAPLPFDYTPPVWEVQQPLDLIGVSIASLVAGLLVWSIYISLIAQQVRDGHIRLGQIVTRLPLNILWLMIVGAILPVLLLIVYMPFVILAAGFSVFSTFLAAIVDWAGRLTVLWIGLFLVFTIHGLFLNNRGPLRALWDSVRVVQWNVTATLLLTMLIVLLNLALTYIWTLAPAGSWLMVVAIAGHAFVNTGLLTATFVFFKDRYRYWHETRIQLLAELERRRVGQGRG